MTLTQIHLNKAVPVEGNRSINYVGIELRMDQQFFHETSDCTIGYRPDPRLKCCDRDEHAKLRSSLFIAAKAHGLTDEQGETEWRALVAKATKEATKVFMDESGLRATDIVPFNKEMIERAKYAIHEGLKFINGQIFARKRTKKSRGDDWIIQPDLELPLALPEGRKVYIFVQNRSSHDREGVRSYKIGGSYDVDKRLAQHRTSNPDTTYVGTFTEAGCVTESAVQAMLAHCLQPGAKEWFLLSEEQVAALLNFSQLETHVRKFLETGRGAK